MKTKLTDNTKPYIISFPRHCIQMHTIHQRFQWTAAVALIAHLIKRSRTRTPSPKRNIRSSLCPCWHENLYPMNILLQLKGTLRSIKINAFNYRWDFMKFKHLSEELCFSNTQNLDQVWSILPALEQVKWITLDLRKTYSVYPTYIHVYSLPSKTLQHQC